ncbi:hypothetical protein Scep_004380 [Stephania cephalantha]|uniref:Uncharacterized protein n=1 Tax=Stephania cephalantha TaxID=152367 RepID=A0AAP0KSD3_9MAGN
MAWRHGGSGTAISSGGEATGARRRGLPTVAIRTAATLGLADVVATSSSARPCSFNEVSTTDNGATSARKFVKKKERDIEIYKG